ncbi:MAG: DUF4249 domain-containing protein [Bacteroidota bacterium]|nr:DUF4249 domain-containing protein [Bacteroidota bacterium]
MEIKKYFSAANIILCMGAMLLLFSCKKETTNTSTTLPVVEAYLMPGHIISVKLYLQKELTDTSKYGGPITGQQLAISDGSTNVTLTESAKGVYTYSDTTFLKTGKTYSLTFKYLGNTVTAKSTMPAKPLNFATQYASVTYTKTSTGPNTVQDTLNRFTWSNPDSLNHVLVFKNADGIAFALSARGNETTSDFELNTDQRSVLYATPNIFPYYGHYTVILLRVNQEYIDLLKSNTSRSTSQNLVNTPTNVVNGFGIFTAMQADTVKFDLL